MRAANLGFTVIDGREALGSLQIVGDASYCDECRTEPAETFYALVLAMEVLERKNFSLLNPPSWHVKLLRSDFDGESVVGQKLTRSCACQLATGLSMNEVSSSEKMYTIKVKTKGDNKV